METVKRVVLAVILDHLACQDETYDLDTFVGQSASGVPKVALGFFMALSMSIASSAGQ